jgi:hypothetical protein
LQALPQAPAPSQVATALGSVGVGQTAQASPQLAGEIATQAPPQRW